MTFLEASMFDWVEGNSIFNVTTSQKHSNQTIMEKLDIVQVQISTIVWHKNRMFLS